MLEALRLVRLRLRGVRVSRSVRVGAGVRVEVARGASVVLHPGVVLGERARISAVGGRVIVGPGARLGERAVVVSRTSVVIGSHTVVGDWAAVSDVEPGFVDARRPIRLDAPAPVVIGDGAVIGPHAAVAASVDAGEVVAAYAVV